MAIAADQQRYFSTIEQAIRRRNRVSVSGLLKILSCVCVRTYARKFVNNGCVYVCMSGYVSKSM